MTSDRSPNREWDDPAHAHSYLAERIEVPHRSEGEAVLVECLRAPVARVLDLGSGDGRVLASVLATHPEATGVALDHNPTMLHAVGERFSERLAAGTIEVIDHDLDEALPSTLGTFDAVVSGLAIHHVARDRRRDLYAEIADRLRPGGVVADLDLVRSASEELHDRFIQRVPWDRNPDKAWDRHPSVTDRLDWLDDAGFVNVDCTWRWRELALIVGERPRTG